MVESVIDDILHREKYIESRFGMYDGPPVLVPHAGLYVRPMTLLERVAYRNWVYARPDKPREKGAFFRRTVCDAAGNLTHFEDAAADIERAADAYTLSAVWALAWGMLNGFDPADLIDPASCVVAGGHLTGVELGIRPAGTSGTRSGFRPVRVDTRHVA